MWACKPHSLFIIKITFFDLIDGDNHDEEIGFLFWPTVKFVTQLFLSFFLLHFIGLWFSMNDCWTHTCVVFSCVVQTVMIMLASSFPLRLMSSALSLCSIACMFSVYLHSLASLLLLIILCLTRWSCWALLPRHFTFFYTSRKSSLLTFLGVVRSETI